MTVEAFSVKDGELGRWLESVAGVAGFDVSHGVEQSGFVPTFRNILDVGSTRYREYSSHPRHIATQIAWVSYLFIAQWDGVERPDGFAPKSILVEASMGRTCTTLYASRCGRPTRRSCARPASRLGRRRIRMSDRAGLSLERPRPTDSEGGAIRCHPARSTR